ncbi:TSC22 domain family 1 isoform X1 [Pelobates cultripes]|uniref:TSC22 domain family protein 1 n=1 Tax=Pelobates cultripes TaxID=61616 RepID=A0AAD1VN40_PELCU|nr:TSC22 domain family 1 isoform X1 [Pelobates cultripes]
MHQPDPAAELAARKMAHPADIPRRGSGAGGNPATGSLSAVNPGMGGHILTGEDFQPSLQMQPQSASSSSSSSTPGAQHPPQTLNLMSQPLLQSGAQIKKKSGFQITSVTPAQISANMSSNNSIAEDTESYDDLDESHTEDLSSSEILDVSLSRATDLGGPERSSSEETLNNFQEADTPGAVSPNQPHLPHQHHLPPNVQQSIMINGNVHHHHHHLHHHGNHQPPHTGLPAAPIAGGNLQNIGSVKQAATGTFDSPVTAAPVSTVPTVASALPVARKSSGPVSTGISPATGGSTTSSANVAGVGGVTASMPSVINVNPSNVTSNVSAVPGNLNSNIVSTSGNGSSASSSINFSGAAAAAGPAAGQQPAAPFTTTSRFRVVKLDSSTEPFKKGRWTCMEFYDKENAVPSEAAAAINKAVESIKQNPLEVTSERESTSGSSVSSNISTLSHYTESVGSGEMGASTVQQPGFQGLGLQQMEFSSTITQNVPAPNIPQSISQSQLAQLQIHSQDSSYSPQKQGQPAQATLNAATGVQPASVNIIGVQSSLGHQQPPVSAMIPQQLPYPQQAQPIQSMPTVQQQQLQYAHQQTATTQMTSGHVMPVNQSSVPGNLPEYLQHPQILQTAVNPIQSSSIGVGNTAAVPVVQAQVMQAQIQSSTTQAPPTAVPTQSVAHAQATMPATGGQILGVGQQASLSTAVPQAATSQPSTSVLQQGAPIPSQQVLPPSQGIQLGAPGLPQQVILAPQNTLLPAKPQTQLIEPTVQGMTSQQVPVVSPLHAVTSVPPVQQLSTNISSVISPAGTALGSLPTVAQPSPAQNGNLLQNINQTPAIPSVPTAQSMPLQVAQSTGQYLAPSLIQSVASQIEEAQRLGISVAGLPHISEGIALDSSGAGTLLPLKSLPLSTALVDGEDESSSGASVVAIDNKIEQAMDLVKSHLMYAVREEVEVLKEQIKELIEKNSQLEQENSLLKTLASPEQLAQFQAQLQSGSPPSSSSGSQPTGNTPASTQPASQSSGPSA